MDSGSRIVSEIFGWKRTEQVNTDSLNRDMHSCLGKTPTYMERGQLRLTEYLEQFLGICYSIIALLSMSLVPQVTGYI